MGEKFSKVNGVDDRSGVYNRRTPAPSTANDDLFWTLRPVEEQSPGGDEEEDLFWTWRPVQNQSSEGDGDEEVDLFWNWRTGHDERDHQATDVTDDETSVQNVTAELPENQETPTSDIEILTTPDLVSIDLDWDEKIQPVLVNLAEAEIQDDEVEDEDEASAVIMEINTSHYKIGDILAEGSSGLIYEATRVEDGMKVAVKKVSTRKHMDYISMPGSPMPLPREVALHMLACEGTFAPEIVQLLDWRVYPDCYVMVLEYPSPCMDLREFATSKGGKLYEDMAKDIMWQATMAAQACCQKRVFHREITMENLLVTTDHLFVKLTDFGCGDLLQESTYRVFMGTQDYACPEFFEKGEYYGKPATVYSLGSLLFAMLCGTFPNCNDRYSINERIWSKVGLTEECCDFIEACLQEDPVKRIELEKILEHKWFQDKYPADDLQAPVHSESDDDIEDPGDAGPEFSDDDDDDDDDGEDNQPPGSKIQKINGCYYNMGRKLGKDRFGTLFEGTRRLDDLKVLVKVVRKSKKIREAYINILGYPEPLPREVGLQGLACQGEYVPVILQILGWQDFQDHYVMVLEGPSACMDVDKFVQRNEGTVAESVAQFILGQATEAAEICCRRRVFHRDIKMENLLINPETLVVKLMNFGCGDLFKESPYREFMGTLNYFCPEYFEHSEYLAKSATVYSLGVLLFVMVCGRFPSSDDKSRINSKTWRKDGLTEGCCSLIQACLQEDPDERIDLDKILHHKWFTGENPASKEIFREINGCWYKIGKKLGEGGFGQVLEGTRVHDGLKVAVKRIKKEGDVREDYIKISGHPKPLPREVGLHMLACQKGPIPVILQFLDWQDDLNHFDMVLEYPIPCMDVQDFINSKGGCVKEDIAQKIFGQVTEASEICCTRGVFHRDIKPQNLLINPNTLEVKLIDFGCGDLMKKTAYTTYRGTRIYTCPEYIKNREYHGKPATVYSLGVLLFFMVCGRYPDFIDKDQISDRNWKRAGMTKRCCDLIQACLQEDPNQRLPLDEIRKHKWFQE